MAGAFNRLLLSVLSTAHGTGTVAGLQAEEGWEAPKSPVAFSGLITFYASNSTCAMASAEVLEALEGALVIRSADLSVDVFGRSAELTTSEARDDECFAEFPIDGEDMTLRFTAVGEQDRLGRQEDDVKEKLEHFMYSFSVEPERLEGFKLGKVEFEFIPIEVVQGDLTLAAEGGGKDEPQLYREVEGAIARQLNIRSIYVKAWKKGESCWDEAGAGECSVDFNVSVPGKISSLGDAEYRASHVAKALDEGKEEMVDDIMRGTDLTGLSMPVEEITDFEAGDQLPETASVRGKLSFQVWNEDGDMQGLTCTQALNAVEAALMTTLHAAQADIQVEHDGTCDNSADELTDDSRSEWEVKWSAPVQGRDNLAEAVKDDLESEVEGKLMEALTQSTAGTDDLKELRVREVEIEVELGGPWTISADATEPTDDAAPADNAEQAPPQEHELVGMNHTVIQCTMSFKAGATCKQLQEALELSLPELLHTWAVEAARPVPCDDDANAVEDIEPRNVTITAIVPDNRFGGDNFDIKDRVQDTLQQGLAPRLAATLKENGANVEGHTGDRFPDVEQEIFTITFEHLLIIPSELVMAKIVLQSVDTCGVVRKSVRHAVAEVLALSEVYVSVGETCELAATDQVFSEVGATPVFFNVTIPAQAVTTDEGYYRAKSVKQALDRNLTHALKMQLGGPSGAADYKYELQEIEVLGFDINNAPDVETGAEHPSDLASDEDDHEDERPTTTQIESDGAVTDSEEDVASGNPLGLLVMIVPPLLLVGAGFFIYSRSQQQAQIGADGAQTRTSNTEMAQLRV